MNTKITSTSKIFLIISAILISISVFVPVWEIELSAPQYPEGLRLYISSDGIGGDIDIINGLNHYIGMKKINTEDFFEFKILQYLLCTFSALSFIFAIIGKKKFLYVLFLMFLMFGILAMIDFWRWEYDYGHNLAPNAAIIVPGMAYQPPLIGFKQLLNFGAYSIPAIGGWLLVFSGVLLFISVLVETGLYKKVSLRNFNNLSIMILLIAFSSCTIKDTEPIIIGKDNCENCMMGISDNRFACELLTEKGRVYKFDDLSCMISYYKEHKNKLDNAKFYSCDFISPYPLVLLEKMSLVQGDQVNSPMGGNIASFQRTDSANVYIKKTKGNLILWDSLLK